VADQLRARWPKLGTFMDDAEADVLAYIVGAEKPLNALGLGASHLF